MKQVLQNLRTGATEIADVPCPRVGPGQLLIRTAVSLVSAGTERMLVEFARAGHIDKARQQPDKVRMVLDKVRTDGLLPTVEAVRRKLDEPLPLGYCNVGRVVDVGAGVSGFAPGDRVASNGRHAEVVAVPSTLCARVPDSVSDESAAFTVLAAVALQGIRLVRPTLGEAVVVTGLGLVGQLTVQLLRAQGCRVLGIDTNSERVAMARRFGAAGVDLSLGEDAMAAADHFSRGRGVDAVLVCAATKSSEPLHQAALMCRKRGRIVLVGSTGLELSRDDFFKKELSFQVSCSYGPGRYDPAYEEKGQDYPVGYVRWTAQRNFEAVLDMMADERLQPAGLVSHRFPVERADAAYELVTGDEPSLGILLEYDAERQVSDLSVRAPSITFPAAARPPVSTGALSLGFIGSGSHATAVLIPAFASAGARLVTVASNTGVSGAHAARKFRFESATTDTDAVFRDPQLDAVVVTTRHDTHAPFVLEAIETGKPAFVEKPLCLTMAEQTQIESAYADAGPGRRPLIMVGFNRRFAPHVERMKALLSSINGPKSFVITVNAGTVPAGHWAQDPAIGGGRLIGEACHFVDLLRFLTGCPIVEATRSAMDTATADTASLQLRFADGSIGTIHYFANGPKSFPKERIEVFAQGRMLQLDNFRVLRGFGWPGFRTMRLWRQDKGHAACATAFLNALRQGAESPIPFEEILEVSRVTITLAAPS